MTDINELTAKLKAAEELQLNAREVSNQLRHLADNEIDSDSFAVVTENYNGREVEFERPITDLAIDAACVVDALTEALEAAEKQRDSWRRLAEQNIAERERDIAALTDARQRIADLESKLAQSESWSVSAQNYIASLEARTLTVKLKQYDEFWIEHIAPGCPDGYAKGFIDGRNYGEKQIKTACADAGIKLQIEGE